MEKTPHQSVAWTDLIASDSNIEPDLKKAYAEKAQLRDGYIPPAVQAMLPEDVLEIEKAVSVIDAKVARGVSSYAYYVKLLRKIQVLLVENSPEFFATLPLELQHAIRNAKIRMPTEHEVDRNIFQVIERPNGSLRGGLSFEMMVQDVMNYSALSKRITLAYDQYKKEFEKHIKAA
jgi:hypothetical protein